jgi:hypothetical protein
MGIGLPGIMIFNVERPLNFNITSSIIRFIEEI